jgi:hypothetical protein
MDTTYHDQWRKQDRKKYPEKYRIRELRANLRNSYGITLEQYQQMVNQQNNLCLGCGRPPRGNHVNARRLNVDHDHKTGKVRGLLCSECNRALGLVDENIDTLINLAAYVERHK